MNKLLVIKFNIVLFTVTGILWLTSGIFTHGDYISTELGQAFGWILGIMCLISFIVTIFTINNE